jgi:hypothetical protein
MQQELEFSLILSGQGRDLELINAYLLTNSWLNSWVYGPATLIVVAKVTLDEYINTDSQCMAIRTMTVETGFEHELPVSYYVINDSGYPVWKSSDKQPFIEVNAMGEIEEINSLSPLSKIMPISLTSHQNGELDLTPSSLIESPKKINQLLIKNNFDNQTTRSTHKRERDQEEPIFITRSYRPLNRIESPPISSETESVDEPDDYGTGNCILF